MNKVLKFATIAMSMILFGCNNGDNKAPTQGAPMFLVSTMQAKMQDIPIAFEFSGQTVSDMDVIVKAKVSGTIKEQFFKAGSKVNAGDKLYLIDQQKYQAAYDAANANLKSAIANFQNATNDFNRAKILFDKAIISKKEFDSAQAVFNSSQAAVSVAKANLQNVKLDLDYTIVTAPFSGVISDTQKDIGTYVTQADANLVRLTKLDPIYVDFSISDNQKMQLDANLNSGNFAQNPLSATMQINGKIYKGEVSFIDNVVDANTGTIRAKAKFDNPNYEIKPGLYTKISINGFYQKNGFSIPQVAILQDLQSTYVYVLKDGVVVKTPIKISDENATQAVVFDGLKDGDLIILDNFSKIRPGQKVQPITDEKGGK